MIQLSNITKYYGDQTLFENASVAINSRERVGLVGRNGSGKSTLFKIITGEEHADKGQVLFPKGYRIGKLSQHLEFNEANIVAEACLGLPPDERDQTYRAEILLGGLGFSEADMLRPASYFSGGYQIRINLCRLLLSEPDMLLLDEPTNYLDIVSARWLADTLRSWKGELIVITHDRSFMDSVTTHTMIIHRNEFRKIPGSTDKMFEAIAVDEEVYEKTRLNDEKKRKEMEQFINRFRAQASKATLVQSRVKALEKMGVREQLTDEDTLEFSFAFKEAFSKVLLDVKDPTFGYDPAQPLIRDLSFSIGKKDRIGIIGKNGKGKSTLLRLIARELTAQKGDISISPNTALGYFGQTNIERLGAKLTVEEEISQAHPGMHRTRVRGICGLMMFEGDKALKKVKVLSGGERSRVLLGKIIVTPSNLLLLDEPTNHLDMDSVEALKDALKDFEGSLVLVTHNEMLLRELCNRLIVFQGEQPFVLEGDYESFLDKIGWEGEEQSGPTKRKSEAKPPKQSANAAPSGNSEKQIKKLEKQITTLEEQQRKQHQLLEQATAERNTEKIRAIAQTLKTIEEQIEDTFQKIAEI